MVHPKKFLLRHNPLWTTHRSLQRMRYMLLQPQGLSTVRWVTGALPAEPGAKNVRLQLELHTEDEQAQRNKKKH